MKEDNSFYDADDIRRRKNVDQHPQFYWRAIYQADKDNYVILPYMHINNSDSGRPDYMEVLVLQNHIVRYHDEYLDFVKKQALSRTEYTRAEMMHVQNFRDKIEYNKGLILLPPEHPDYMTLISDFSLRLNPEDIAKLNAIDGVVAEEETKPEKKDRNERLLDVMNMIADKLDRMDERITALESK